MTQLHPALGAAGLATVCAYVALVPLVFDPGAIGAFPGPKSLAAHALGFVLFGLVLLHVVAYRREALVWTRVHTMTAVLIGLAFVATALAVDRNLALYGAFDRRLGLTSILSSAILFFGVTAFVRTRTALVGFAIAACLPLVPVLAYQALQVTGNDPLNWTDPEFVMRRPFATFGNADGLGQYLGTLSVAAIAQALVPGTRLARPLRGALLALGSAALVGAVFTNTRAIFAGYGIATFALAALWLARPGSARLRLSIAAVALALALGAGLLARGQIASAVDAMLELGPSLTADRTVTSVGSAGARALIYRVATEIVRDHPILGVGPDNYVGVFGRYRPPEATRVLATTAPETSTHSWILHWATGMGLVGLGAFLGVIALAMLDGVRRPDPIRTAALIGIASFLANGLVTVNDVGTDWLLWALLGVVVVRAPPSVTPPAQGGRRRARSRGAGRAPRLVLAITGIAILIAAAAVATMELRALGAARSAETARIARMTGDLPTAVTAAERATEQDPSRAEYWNGLGIGLASSGRFDRALRAFRRATDLAPYEPTFASNLVRAHVVLAPTQPSLRGVAVELASKALADHPNLPDLYWTLALAYFAEGRASEGAAAAERAIADGALGFDGLVEEQTGRYYFSVGELSSSETWLRRSIVHLQGRRGFDARLTLTQVLLRQGRDPEAVAMVNTILAIDPAYEPALRLRATIPTTP